MGLENGLVMAADLETKHLETAYDVDGGVAVDVVAFSPDGDMLAVAAHDHCVHMLKRKGEGEEDGGIAFERAFKLEGHTSHVKHLDWSADSGTYAYVPLQYRQTL